MKCSWIVTLLLASLPVLRARDAFFDCNRNNIDCGPGDCVTPDDPNEGTCICHTGDFTTPNTDNPCFVPGDGACGDPSVCNGNGDCRTVIPWKSETCFCSDDYFGTFCDKERVVVTCAGREMTVQITPYGNNGDGTLTDFGGKIYATGHSADPDCNLDAITATLATFEKTFDLYAASPCGMQKIDPTDPATDPTVYELVLRVQHSQDLLVANDLRVVAKCSIDPNANIGVGTGVISATNQELPNSVTKDELTTLVQLDLLTKPESGGTDFTLVANDAAIAIGTDLHLRFFMEEPNHAGYNMFKVLQCVGQDAASSETVQVTIVGTDGCPELRDPIVTVDHIGPATHSYYSNNQINGQNGIRVSVPIQIFKFPGADSVFFDCNVIMCKDREDGDCAPSDCSGVNGLGRRRREADAESVQVQARVRVFSSDDAFEANKTVSQDGDRASNSADCLQEPTTQSIIAVFSVTVLVLLIACIVIAACLLRRNRRNKGDNFDQTSATSSTAHLSIPRPKV